MAEVSGKTLYCLVFQEDNCCKISWRGYFLLEFILPESLASVEE